MRKVFLTGMTNWQELGHMKSRHGGGSCWVLSLKFERKHVDLDQSVLCANAWVTAWERSFLKSFLHPPWCERPWGALAHSERRACIEIPGMRFGWIRLSAVSAKTPNDFAGKQLKGSVWWLAQGLCLMLSACLVMQTLAMKSMFETCFN